MIKYILTDLDGVIRLWDNQKLKYLEKEMGITHQNLLSICFEKELINDVIIGDISDEKWRKKVTDIYSKIHENINTNQIIDSWINSDYKIEHKVIELYKQYFPEAKLVLVTNATSKLDSDMKEAMIFNLFDHIFNSSEMGLTKPNKIYYQFVQSQLNFHYDEVLYIDDSNANIETGKLLGMKSHLYKDIEKLEVFLKLH